MDSGERRQAFAILLLCTGIVQQSVAESGGALSCTERGSIGGALMAFSSNPVQDGQSDANGTLTLTIAPELRCSWNDGLARLTFTPALRLADSYDPRRDDTDLRELELIYYGNAWWSRVGVGIVTWAKLEGRRIVDIVNQRDLAGFVDTDDKLGQPLISAGWQTSVGAWELYALPYFREGTFPGREGRLRGPFPVDVSQPVYESSQRRHHLDFAARYSTELGHFDFATSYFRGTGREPRVTLGTDQRDYLVLIPHYDIIEQIGLEGQATFGPLLLKFEGYHRHGNGRPYQAFGMGGEYTFFNVKEGNSDIGVFAEYLYDGRDAIAPPTNFDEELFLGVRWTRNDLADTTLLSGVLLDTRTTSQAFRLEFATRVSKHFTVEVQGQLFRNVSPSEAVLFAARKDHNLILKVAYNFGSVE